jgi:hypothetical protein
MGSVVMPPIVLVAATLDIRLDARQEDQPYCDHELLSVT